MTDTAPLKLRAHDAEDLRALAACLQDALVPVVDITYLKSEKRFVMIANRFKWEGGAQSVPASEPGVSAPASAPVSAPASAPTSAPASAPVEREPDARFEEAGERPLHARVNCAVYFDWVRKVRYQGLELRQKDRILNLLTILADPGAITLIFSDGGAIRLEVSGVRCHMEDLGEPWPTHWRPGHAEAAALDSD